MLRKTAEEIGCVLSSMCRTTESELVSDTRPEKRQGKRPPPINLIVQWSSIVSDLEKWGPW